MLMFTRCFFLRGGYQRLVHSGDILKNDKISWSILQECVFANEVGKEIKLETCSDYLLDWCLERYFIKFSFNKLILTGNYFLIKSGVKCLWNRNSFCSEIILIWGLCASRTKPWQCTHNKTRLNLNELETHHFIFFFKKKLQSWTSETYKIETETWIQILFSSGTLPNQ